MNKLIIAIVAISFLLCHKSNAQFVLKLGEVKKHKIVDSGELKNKNSQSRPNYAQVIFTSDLGGAIWVDNKKYLLEANIESSKIPVGESFNYYFVTKDNLFATADKTKKIRKFEIEKKSTLKIRIQPSAKFKAFVKQQKALEKSEEIYKHIVSQFISIGSNLDMQSHEVTIRQYAQFIKETGAPKDKQTEEASLVIKYVSSENGIRFREEYIDWRYDPMGNLIDLQDEKLLRHPVVNVSWYEAKAFCAWLSYKDSNYDYRLPYIQEWESVASLFSDIPVSEQANFADASLQKLLPNKIVAEEIDDHFDLTSPVGAFKANPKGFYDLLGNVAEWMEDDFNDDRNNRKVIKGGSYFIVPQSDLIENKKHSYFMAKRHSAIGFRICREPKRGS